MEPVGVQIVKEPRSFLLTTRFLSDVLTVDADSEWYSPLDLFEVYSGWCRQRFGKEPMAFRSFCQQLTNMENDNGDKKFQKKKISAWRYRCTVDRSANDFIPISIKGKKPRPTLVR